MEVSIVCQGENDMRYIVVKIMSAEIKKKER
jgi:hypothetical protein